MGERTKPLDSFSFPTWPGGSPLGPVGSVVPLGEVALVWLPPDNTGDLCGDPLPRGWVSLVSRTTLSFASCCMISLVRSASSSAAIARTASSTVKPFKCTDACDASGRVASACCPVEAGLRSAPRDDGPLSLPASRQSLGRPAASKANCSSSTSSSSSPPPSETAPELTVAASSSSSAEACETSPSPDLSPGLLCPGGQVRAATTLADRPPGLSCLTGESSSVLLAVTPRVSLEASLVVPSCCRRRSERCGEEDEPGMWRGRGF